MHVTRCGRQPALVFYDVRAAYYQVLRECLTGADLDDRVLLQLFSKLGVPSHAFSELQAQLSRLATLADSGCTPHTVALLEEVFVGTWFRMDQHVPLVATSAGVRPGDPLADVLFAVSFSAYAKAVQEALSAAGLATTLPASAAAPPWGPREPVPLGPASWADDFAAMHAADDHLALLALVREATSLYLTHATANGIQLAFATDKTAAVLPPKACYDPSVARGPTSGELFLPIVDGITGRTHHLPVVQAYKHLGGVVTSNFTVTPEIRFRHSQAAWTLRPLKGPLFGNPSIPLPTRRHLLLSLVASKFSFSSATLELHVAGHFRLWARLYTSLFRALFPRAAITGKLHSFTVLHKAAVCTPPLALAKARGSLLQRIMRHGLRALRQLLWLQWEAAPTRSWLGQLVGDLRHVGMYCQGARTVLTAPCPVRALLEAICDDHTWWQRQIRAAIRICLRDLEAWHNAHAGSTPLPAPSEPPAPSPDEAVAHDPDPDADPCFACPLCDATFPLRKHLGVHLARRHGLVAPARLYAPQPFCIACLRHFHTLPRAQAHLKSSKKCLLRASHLMPPLTITQVKEAEAEDKLLTRKLKHGNWQLFSAAPPILPVYGPVQPTREELRNFLGDEAPLSLLQDPPADLDLVTWVRREAGFTTVEPVRVKAVSFWHKRIGAACNRV